MNFPTALNNAVDTHPYPLLFATVSGAHLYGFPSQDSDYDLRGAHILPVAELVGLEEPRETIDIETSTTLISSSIKMSTRSSGKN